MLEARSHPLGPLALTLLALGLVPGVAQAANGLRPRTGATFTDVPCVQTVTRGDVVHFDYAVPFDDTELTADELPDSRQMQMLAFAEQRFDFAFPVWINQADFDRAEANGDVTREFGPEDTLETSTRWPAGTWLRITPDDARVPITLEQAAMGFDWDTAAATPGTWLVAVYTWEPENNLWSPRFGAVRVEAPGDPESAGPTVFLPREDGLLADRAEPLVLTGCVEAPAGSTLTASWGTIVGVDEPEWVPFLEDEPVESGALSLEFMAPAETGSTVKLRLEITDPAGRTYVAYSPTPIGVVGTAPPAEDGGEGCECASESRDRRGSLAGLAVVVLMLGARRRSVTGKGRAARCAR